VPFGYTPHAGSLRVEVLKKIKNVFTLLAKNKKNVVKILG
jgi:hypothetical protein